MDKQICILQTSFAKRDDIVAYLQQGLPGVKVTFITDDTLLSDVRAAGGPTPSVYARMSLYAQAAVLKGADMIFNTCSSVGDVADHIARTVEIPVVRIEDPVCRLAARECKRVALLSTVPTSAPPIARLIQRYAAAQGKEVEYLHINEDGAWQALCAGDPETHNQLLLQRIHQLEQEDFDGVVLTQVSMRALLPELGNTGIPVWCSFQSGLDMVIEKMKEGE